MPQDLRHRAAAILLCAALFAACTVESRHGWGFTLSATSDLTRVEVHAAAVRFAFVYEHQCPISDGACGAHA